MGMSLTICHVDGKVLVATLTLSNLVMDFDKVGAISFMSLTETPSRLVALLALD